MELAVTGAQVEPIASGAQLVLEKSGRKIAYSRLKVTDANGKELSARIEVSGSASVPRAGSGVAPEASSRISSAEQGFRRDAENDTPEACAPQLVVLVDDREAVYPIRIDPTFSDANWVSMGGIPGANGGVYAAVTDGSGNLYIGGTFTMVGDAFANRIAKWNGSSWSALGSGIAGTVYALAVSGSDLYAGGVFTTAGGNVSSYIARAILGDAPGYNQQTGTPLSGGAMQFSYVGDPATNYALDRTFSLSPPISWVGQKTNTMSVSGMLMFTNTPVPGTNNFWRVRAVP